jgi:hypothetical protein
LLVIISNNHQITTLSNKKFLGININDTMNWSGHVEHIIPKLSSACYIMRSVKPYMPLKTLKTIYYSYFNTIMSYGLLFWGNSPQCSRVFIMQKRIIRVMTNCNNRVSCSLFRRLEILPLASQYILSLLELEFLLRPTDSRPVRLGIGPPYGTLDQILSCSSFFC